MTEKIYLHLLILCGILYQGIFATLLDEDGRKSSDLVVRKRRVINHLPQDRPPLQIHEVNYIVNIKQNFHIHCVGAILSHLTVITSAPCVSGPESSYGIFSGAVAYGQPANQHNITSKKSYYGSPPHGSLDGISLITVHPPFVYSPKVGQIGLFTGLLPVGTLVTVFGWGNKYRIQPGPKVKSELRAITLPIINLGECEHYYKRHYDIGGKHVCTYHELKYCAKNDGGAPLVFNNRLAGIHVWKGELPGQKNPDVFINLLRSDYSGWIRENTQ